MSTNINTNTPETPPPQGTNGAQGTPTTSPVGFQAGNAANTTAILALIRAMMTLYEYKNDAFVQQSRTESTIANSYSSSQVELGNQEMTELEIQGAFSAVSGLFTAGLGFKGMMEENNLNLSGKQDEITASNKFAAGIKANPEVKFADEPEEESAVVRPEEEDEVLELEEAQPEASRPENKKLTPKQEERLEEMIQEMKSGNYKMTETETTGRRFINRKTEYKAADASKAQNEGFTDKDVLDTLSEPQAVRLKDAANEQIAGKQKILDDAKGQLRMNFDKRNMWSTAVSGIFTGAGNIGAGILKQQQGEQQADNTQYQTAQQQFQSLSKETESQSDKDLQSAESLTQLIPEIDKSNNAILSA